MSFGLNPEGVLPTPRPPTQENWQGPAPPTEASYQTQLAPRPPGEDASSHVAPRQPQFFMTQVAKAFRHEMDVRQNHRRQSVANDVTMGRFTTPGGAVLLPRSARFPERAGELSPLTVNHNIRVKADITRAETPALPKCLQQYSERQAQLLAEVKDASFQSVATDTPDVVIERIITDVAGLRQRQLRCDEVEIARTPESLHSVPSHDVVPRAPKLRHYSVEAVTARIDTEADSYKRNIVSFFEKAKEMKAQATHIPVARNLLTPEVRDHRRDEVLVRRQDIQTRREEQSKEVMRRHEERIQRHYEAAAAGQTRRLCLYFASVVNAQFAGTVLRAVVTARRQAQFNVQRHFCAVVRIHVVFMRLLNNVRQRGVSDLATRLKRLLYFVVSTRSFRKKQAVQKISFLLYQVARSKRAVNAIRKFRLQLAVCSRAVQRYIMRKRCQLGMLSRKWCRIWEEHFADEFPLTVADRHAALVDHLRERRLLIEAMQEQQIGRPPHIPLFPTDAKMQVLITDALARRNERDLCLTCHKN